MGKNISAGYLKYQIIRTKRIVSSVAAHYVTTKIQRLTPAQRYKARELLRMVQDNVNQLYLTFALPGVTEFERVNAFFQSSKANPDKAFGELDLHHRTLESRVYDNRGNQKSLSQIDFRAKFATEFNDLRKNDGNSENTLLAVKQRCLEMLMTCISQVEMRLPDQTNVFSELVALSPDVILNQIRRVDFGKLPYQHLMGEDSNKIEEEYRQMIHINWREELPDGVIPTDTEYFWLQFRQMRRSDSDDRCDVCCVVKLRIVLSVSPH